MQPSDETPETKTPQDETASGEQQGPIEEIATERIPAASAEQGDGIAELPTERIPLVAIPELPTEKTGLPSVFELPTEKIAAPTVSDLPTQRIAVTAPPPLDQPVAPEVTIADEPAAMGPYMPIVTAPPLLRETNVTGAARRGGFLAPVRQHPRVSVMVLVVVLLVLAAVPLVSQLAYAAHTTVKVQRPTLAATSTALPAGTPDPHGLDWIAAARNQAEVDYVNGLISHMSLDEEIGQMIMAGFLETQISPGLLTQLKQYHVGSVVFYAWNITGNDQVIQFTHDLQANADLPLFIATDQEGGGVNRLLAIDGPLPSASQIGATNDPNYAKQRGQHDASELARLGINVNFAPVVDVMNTTGGALGGRTFGSTPAQVTKMAGAYLSGLQQSQQVVGTLKHFPGLGDVPTDPHEVLSTLNRSESDLEKIDWAPYKALIATGQVKMIMSTHVVLAAIDPTRPASLSAPVLTGILRDKLGFNGVIVTDGIYMKSLAAHYSFDQIVLDAVEAGNDIICSTYSIESTAEAERVIHQAVTDGTITKQRIDDSVRRILLLKLQYGVLSMPRA
jgi:beta-N-acetylhexosaminidase